MNKALCFNFKKITTTFTGTGATLTSTLAFYRFALAGEIFTVGAKNCFPNVYTTSAADAPGLLATASQPTILGTLIPYAPSSAAVGADLVLLYTTFCLTNGVCCSSNLCNGSNKLGLNYFNLLLLGASVLSIKSIF